MNLSYNLNQMISNRIIYFISSLLLISFIGCKEKEAKKKPWEIQRDKMMAIHDSTMLEFENLMTWQDSISRQIEGLDTASNSYQNGTAVILDLRKAEEDMLNWMRNYEIPDPEKQSEEEITSYIAIKTKEIIEVDKITKKSLQAASDFKP